MRFLFIFLDGLGLGSDDPTINPLAHPVMPVLEKLLGGRRLIADSLSEGEDNYLESDRVTLLALDTQLGVDGLPQSATGQAVLLTGQNVPQRIGYHYGPKPNPQVAEFVKNGNLFSRLKGLKKRVAFLNAYPPRYFEAIHSGRRNYSAIPLAAATAGLSLMNVFDLQAGRAISADFTGKGWHTHLDLPGTPVLTPYEAGGRLSGLAAGFDFSFFEFWLSDYAGHAQDFNAAFDLLKTFDQVLAGLTDTWDDSSGLVLITSDHGNMEDLSTRRHTANPVPALVIGAPEMRHEFIKGMDDLADVAPAIIRLFQT
jgi:2,3-bisphosphoglycerate-independent phosphoglycerate mutase